MGFSWCMGAEEFFKDSEFDLSQKEAHTTGVYQGF